MNRKIVFTALVMLLISTLIIYGSAQVETEKGPNSSKPQVTAAPFYVRGFGVGPGGRPRTDEMVLLQAKVGVGAINYVQIIPPAPDRTILQTGKLRIEMQDGSVQEIGVERVKKVTIVD
jgi:hypothetical protein